MWLTAIALSAHGSYPTHFGDYLLSRLPAHQAMAGYPDRRGIYP